MTILKHFPGPPLSDIVELLWYSYREAAGVPSGSREAILPDGCAHLAINLSQDQIGLYKNLQSAYQSNLGGTIFCGPHSTPYAFSRMATEVIGVLFRPAGVFRLLSVPTEEFQNTQIPMDLVIGRNDLREQLIASSTPAAMFILLEQFLLRRLQRRQPLHRAVRYAVYAFEHDAFVSVARVLDKIGLSERRFSRIFSEQVGLTPKLFQRVRRFQKTMGSLPSQKEVDWAATATANGYYDQAHLINDFRSFSSVTPSVFLDSRVVLRNHLPLRG